MPDGRGGRFLVWAEVAQNRSRPRRNEHPFHLRQSELVEALTEIWPAFQPEPSMTASAKRATWAVLPGDGAGPSPSLELQADLDSANVNAATALGAWRVDAVAPADPAMFLAALESVPAATDRTIRIGWDIQFWIRLAERLRWAVRCHEYLPSIRADSASTTPAGKKGGGRGRARPRTPAARFEAEWELAEAVEDSIVEAFARAMPAVCGALQAGTARQADVQVALREPHALVRHFLRAQLQSLIRRRPLTQTVLGRLKGTFLAQALPAPPIYRGALGDGQPEVIDEQTWVQWRRWRDRIQRSAADADETICFRLAEARASAPDGWRLEWLLSSRRDPSLLVPLAEFWACGKRQRPSPRSVREVLLQLGQACRIFGKLWEGMDSAAPSEVPLSRDEALVFLREQAPILQGAGFRVIVPAWWTATGQRRLRLRLTPRGVAKTTAAASDGPGFFGFDTLVKFTPQVMLDGKPLTKAEWAQVVAAKEGLVQLRGEWMELRSDEIARLEEHWNAGEEAVFLSVRDMFRAEADADGPEIVADGELGQALAALRGTGALDQLAQPAGFVGELRAYQLRGFSWLAYLENLGFGACLADDMGLGKTVQMIAAVLHDKTRYPDCGATLLVAPTSVLGNWQRETGRFAPSLTTHIHHGPGRPRTKDSFEDAAAGADLVIVSFAIARSDAKILQQVPWRRLVVDESQNIKNPSAAVTKAMRSIKAARRVALTGTPVENRLMDLWSLFSMLNPDYLGSMTAFRKDVERPIMRDGDKPAAERLRRMVRPFILRRMKTDKAIIKDLPEKVEQVAYCNLSGEQATLYEAVLNDLEKKLRDKLGPSRLGLMLATLTRLKQICNHPAQFLQDGSEFAESRSHKLARVCEMLDEIDAEGESALVFTQFTEIGKSLEALLRQRYRAAIYYLHGGTSRARREVMMEEFQNPNSPPAIFVLSLRAGGTGITLTRANHVIHFDRWWNPAVENQATDRAYRIGQEKRVFVHKMVTMGTLEERIDALIESKKKLAEEIVGNDESWLASLDNEAFRKLIALDRGNAVVG